jgi:pimeloyl-ACP methyl ester carboxylesterase
VTTVTTTTPAWFREQIALAPTHHQVTVDGRSIRYRSWGSPRQAQIVLVHGGAANGAWWDHIAPSLLRFGQVHAIDLSGQGQSDWASEYTLEGWAREVTALTNQVGQRGEPTFLIGHSRGGFVALLANAETTASVGGLVLIESAFDVDPPAQPARQASRSQRGALPTREEMVARFRPHPRDVPALDYLLKHIAEQSVVESSGRWQWQFDRGFLGRVKAMRTEEIRSTSVNVLQIRGSHGLLSATTAEAARAALRTDSQIVVVEGAGHHIMLQKPRELATLLCETIASWMLPDDATSSC